MRHRPDSMIYRELAGLFEELALRAEHHETAPAAEGPAKPRAPRRAPAIVRPSGESDDVTQAQARRILRSNGYAEVKR